MSNIDPTGMQFFMPCRHDHRFVGRAKKCLKQRNRKSANPSLEGYIEFPSYVAVPIEDRLMVLVRHA